MPAFLSRWIFTTEFWMTAAGVYIMRDLGQAGDGSQAGWSMLGIGAATGAYAWSRGNAKAKANS